ncbi:MAG TPA: DUF2132 domain-containing protein [Spirochaetaceae bacterium]|nr:DUF2132 domain-containing protein [Spirochaetaceae bacterium]
MSEEQPNNPLHGLTLEAILTRLVDYYTWEGLASRIRIRCFSNDPSLTSSLRFLRRTPWARTKVETLYLRTNFDIPARPVYGPSRGARTAATSTRPKATRALSSTKGPRRDIRGSKTVGPRTRDTPKRKTGE